MRMQSYLLSIGLVCLTCSAAISAVIYESATLGPTSITKAQVLGDEVPASNVVDTNFIGARFQIVNTATTTRIGGHFSGGFENDTFFGGLIRLSSEMDFPDSGDLSTSDVLGSTLMSFSEPSAETFGHLSVQLTPGWYGVVFGSGLFGTNGRGFAIRNGAEIGLPQYFNWQPSNAWFNLADLGVPGLGNRRFVVEGTQSPEPPASVLALIALSIVAVRRRNRSKISR